MKDITVRLTFTEPVLGTTSGNPELHKTYIASKAPDAKKMEEEVAELGVEEVEKKDMTVFPRMKNEKGEEVPFLWDYQIRGFFKSACGFLRDVKGSLSKDVKAYKKKIDGLVFIRERKIPISFTGEIGNLQRPLRAQTMQGDRVALANSEMIPAGATVQFTIRCLNDDYADVVKEWLDYGQYMGLMQWRSGGYGRFTWEEISETSKGFNED